MFTWGKLNIANITVYITYYSVHAILYCLTLFYHDIVLQKMLQILLDSSIACTLSIFICFMFYIEQWLPKKNNDISGLSLCPFGCFDVNVNIKVICFDYYFQQIQYLNWNIFLIFHLFVGKDDCHSYSVAIRCNLR